MNIKDDVIYYIDYECNNYDPKLYFENWEKGTVLANTIKKPLICKLFYKFSYKIFKFQIKK